MGFVLLISFSGSDHDIKQPCAKDDGENGERGGGTPIPYHHYFLVHVTFLSLVIPFM